MSVVHQTDPGIKGAPSGEHFKVGMSQPQVPFRSKIACHLETGSGGGGIGHIEQQGSVCAAGEIEGAERDRVSGKISEAGIGDAATSQHGSGDRVSEKNDVTVGGESDIGVYASGAEAQRQNKCFGTIGRGVGTCTAVGETDGGKEQGGKSPGHAGILPLLGAADVTRLVCRR